MERAKEKVTPTPMVTQRGSASASARSTRRGMGSGTERGWGSASETQRAKEWGMGWGKTKERAKVTRTGSRSEMGWASPRRTAGAWARCRVCPAT